MLSPFDSNALSSQNSGPRSTSAQPAREASAEHTSSAIRKSTGTSNDRRLVDDDDEGSSSEEDDSSDDSSDDETSDTETDDSPAKVSAAKKAVKSLLESTEETEKPKHAHKVQSLLDVAIPGAVPPPSMAEYAAYKRRIIHPNTAFDNDGPEDAPYTANTEEFLDAKRAANLPLEISTVHSNLGSKRMIRTMSRGENIPSLTDPEAKRPKTFLLGTDLSPESAHALEWTIGTVLRDSNVLYVVCANEDEIANGTSNNVTPQQQEDDRMEAMTQLTTLISKLLKMTRLQVHVIIEVIHCKSPKHLLTALIDYVNPTMVILGSRGRSAIKGVLLGSFSNYIVERSSVPVMVARRKLQKTKHKDLNVRLANNLRAHTGLEHAIVD
jgi:nucleotide-binding universal stress UspA family protein